VPAEAMAARTRPEVGPQPAILLIDDEPYILRFISSALVGHGFAVDSAKDGEHGLETPARSAPPSRDIVLSTSGAVSVPGIGGSADDLIGCAPISTGPATACNWWASPLFDGGPWGLTGANVDAVDVP